MRGRGGAVAQGRGGAVAQGREGAGAQAPQVLPGNAVNTSL